MTQTITTQVTRYCLEKDIKIPSNHTGTLSPVSTCGTSHISSDTSSIASPDLVSVDPQTIKEKDSYCGEPINHMCSVHQVTQNTLFRENAFASVMKVKEINPVRNEGVIAVESGEENLMRTCSSGNPVCTYSGNICSSPEEKKNSETETVIQVIIPCPQKTPMAEVGNVILSVDTSSGADYRVFQGKLKHNEQLHQKTTEEENLQSHEQQRSQQIIEQEDTERKKKEIFRIQKEREQETIKIRQQQLAQKQEQDRIRKEFHNQRRQREEVVAQARAKEEQEKKANEEKRKSKEQCFFPVYPQPDQPQQPIREQQTSSERNGIIESTTHVERINCNKSACVIERSTQQEIIGNKSEGHSSKTFNSEREATSTFDMSNINSNLQYSGCVPSIPESSTPALYFDRLASEEVHELKSYARIIEGQGKQLEELRKIHDNLEFRLEEQTRGQLKLEATLELQEKLWVRKYNELENERDQHKKEAENERRKNAHLLDMVNGQNKEMHRMFRRKYDGTQQGHAPGHKEQNQRQNNNQRNSIDRGVAVGSRNSNEQNSFNSITRKNLNPYEILQATGNGDTQEKRITTSMLDFFGL